VSRGLDRFIDDLCTAVGMLLQEDEVPVGFRDTCNLEAGTPDWTRELTRALQRYPIGLVLLSPAYVDPTRVWCKWECDFLERRNAAVAALPDHGMQNKPRLLLILNWVRPDERDMPTDFPRSTQGVGESIASPNDAQERDAVRRVLKHGLAHAIQLVLDDDQEMKASYRRFIQALARYVERQWRGWLELSRDWSALPVPSPNVPMETWRMMHRGSAGHRQKVFCVFIAARPSEVPAERAWRYQDDGESDWQPFTAADSGGQRVGDIVKQLETCGIANVEKWPFQYFVTSMSDALDAVGSRYPIVVVVDPWSVTRLPIYAGALKAFAQQELQRDLSAIPVVILDVGDSEDVRTDFEERIASVFDRKRWQRRLAQKDLEEGLSLSVKLMQLNIRNARADNLPQTGNLPPRINAI
jgi:hypothetical protein